MRDETVKIMAAAFLIFCSASLATGNRAWAAGGAFAVDDSEIAKPGECKVESWLSVATNAAGDLVASTSPACVVNLGLPVEVGGQFQRTKSDGEWGTAAAVKAKTNVLPAETNKIGLALSSGINFDLITHSTASYFVNVPLTLVITEQLRFNINGGWLHEREGRLDWLTWGAGLEWNFIKPLTLIAEIYGQSGRLKAVAEEVPPPNSLRRPRVQAGLRVTPTEKLDLDLIYGHNITGENAHWFTAGLNLRFDAK